MTALATPRQWERSSLVAVISLCAAKVLVHLAVVNRYGYHGDELYFLECGRHLAFGYVDHPPLIPWLARVADALGGSLFALRLPAIAAGAGTLALCALLVHEWGGRWRALTIALLCLLIAPAHLRTGAMLNIPVIEGFLCTLTAYFVVRALSRDERWPWLLAGASLGFAVLAKLSSLLWGAALVLGLLAIPGRRVLATRWPWLGLGVTLVLVAPNLVWQTQNGFATLEFMSNLRHEVREEQGRALFVAGQFLYFHPLAVPVWITGIVFGFTSKGLPSRPFAIQFLILFAFFLFADGKPYYLGSAYPPVLAAGGVALERWLAARPVLWRTLVASLATTGLALGLFTLPVFPLTTVDRVIGALLGRVVPPIALTHDLHGMYGWEEHAATIDRVYQSLPESERKQASVLAGSYAQASAVNWFRAPGTPRAVSGNMAYYLWGPDGTRGNVLIAYGLPETLLERHYRTCTVPARIDVPLARPWDTGLPVYLCREPLGTMAELWPDVRRFGHKQPPLRATNP